MANYENHNLADTQKFLSWAVTVVLLVSPIWPIGLFLLIRKLTKITHPFHGAHPSGIQGSPSPDRQGQPTPSSSCQGRPLDLNGGRGMTILGAVLAIIFGLGLTAFIPISMIGGPLRALAILSPVIGCFCAGLALMWVGSLRNRQVKRFRKYLALIGKREQISIAALAQAMPRSFRRTCKDLQDMLDDGFLATGYLDRSSGRLILGDAGLQESVSTAHSSEKQPLDMHDDDAVLNEIRLLNNRIHDPVMRQKIDRIGEITGKIFAFQKQNPNQSGQLRSFLNYYLPTTLKILQAYARMEEQGVDGKNIRATKARIEGMIDKVIHGFEAQLDKLFQNDAMDIAVDMKVLEQMLEKDGLFCDENMTL